MQTLGRMRSDISNAINIWTGCPKINKEKTVMRNIKYYSETVNIKYEFLTEEKYSKNTY